LWFLVRVTVNDSAAFGDTFSAGIAQWGIVPVRAAPAPDTDILDAAVYTIQTDTMKVVLNATSAKIYDPQFSTMETAVLAFHISSSGVDTIVSVSVEFVGSSNSRLDSSPFLLVRLYRDLMTIGEYDSGFDILVGAMAYDSATSLWTINGLSEVVNGPGSAVDFVVTQITNDSLVQGGDTLIAGIPAGGIQSAKGIFEPVGGDLLDSVVHGIPYFLEITDSAYFDVVDTVTAGDTIYVDLEDAGSNFNPAIPETVLVTVVDLQSSDSETIVLTETGPDSGEFQSLLISSTDPIDSVAENGRLYVNAGDSVGVMRNGSLNSNLVTIVAPPPNTPPIADAGSGTTVATPTSIILDGTLSSDSDGDPLTYLWQLSSGPASVTIVSDTAASTSAFLPQKGTYIFLLTVSDGVDTGSDTVAFTVLNTPPVADAGPDSVIPNPDTIILDASGSSDTDGDTLSYLWAQVSGPAVTGMNPTAVTTPAYLTTSGTYVFMVSIMDSLDTAVDTVVVTVINVPPVAIATGDTTIARPLTLTLSGTGSYDPDSGTLTYSWAQISGPVSASPSPSNAATATIFPPQKGTFEYRLTVDDGIDTDADTVSVIVLNTPPVADAGADTVFSIADTALIYLSAAGSYDTDGDPLNYAWGQLSGTAAVMAGTATVSPSVVIPGPGSYVFSVVVDDGMDSSFDTVTVTAQLLPPTILSAEATVPSGGNIGVLGNDVTTVIAFTVAGDAVGDTLVSLTLTLDGNAGTDAETVVLYVDANENGVFDQITDIQAGILTPVGAGRYSSNSLAAALPAWKGGAESFVVTVTFFDTALVGDTFRARVAAGNARAANRSAGPSSDELSPATFTIVSTPADVLVDPVRPTGMVVDPAAASPVAVLAATLGGEPGDSLTAAAVGFVGGGWSAADTVEIYRDVDRDGLLSVGTDVPLQQLTFMATYFATTSSIPLPASGADSFLFVITISPTAPAGETFHALVPALSVTTTNRTAAPDTDLVSPAEFQVAIPGDTSLEIIVDPSTQSETISPLAIDVTRIMAFTISGDPWDTLERFVVHLEGDAGNVNRLDYVTLYQDVDKNGDLDTSIDVGVTNLGYIGSNFYAMWGLSQPLGATGADSFLVAVSLKDSAPSGETIWAIIPADEVKTTLRDSGPNVAIAAPAFFTVYDLNPPSDFTLLIPGDGHETNQTNVNLRWNAAVDAGSGMKEYAVQVASDPGFTTLLVNTTTGLTRSYTAVLPGDDTYYWRVQATDINGNSRFSSDTRVFLIDVSGPGKPSLISPADGAGTTASAVRFTWSAVSDTLSGLADYRLQLSTDPSFASLLLDSPTGGNLFGEASPPAGTLFWRVAAVDAAGNQTASDSRTLIVAGSGPSAPILISPADGMATQDPAVTFSWFPSTDSTAAITDYRLQIDPTGLFTAPLVDSSTGTNTTGSVTLSVNQTYFWRVRVENALSQVNYSTSRSFTVDTSIFVSLFSPPDASTTTDTRPTFVWTSDGDTFFFELGSDTAGTVVDSVTTTLTSYKTDTLSAGTYFWRVTVEDKAGNTDTSTWYRITVDTTGGVPDTIAPDPFDLLSPAAGACTNAVPVVFAWNPTADTGSGVQSYRLRIARDTAFSLLVVDSSVSSATTSLSAVLVGTDIYYWQVVATDNAGNQRTSNTSRSIVFDTTPPDLPAPLQSPADGTETSAASITFSWSASNDTDCGISGYRIQVDTGTSFSAPIIDQTTAFTFATLTGFFQDTWYWRVTALDNAGNLSAWVGPDSFIMLTTPPAVPTLIAPDSYVGSTTVAFDWTDVTPVGAPLRRYRLQAGTDPSFTTVTFDTMTADTASAMVISGFSAGTWYWRVASEDTVGNVSAWSDSTTFAVDLTTPTIPKFIAPQSDTAFSSTSISLSWNDSGSVPSSGRAGYELLVTTVSGDTFADSFFSTSAASYTTILSGLAETTYQARIRERSGAGVLSSYSSALTFTRDATPPSGVISGISPANGASTTTTAVVFDVNTAAVTDTGSGLTRYRFQVSTDSTFGTLFGDLLTNDTASPFIPLLLFTDSGVTYYWRVAPVDRAGNQGAFGTAESFTRPVPADRTPPVPVSGLTAVADDALNIALIWFESPSSDMPNGGQYNIYWNEGRDTAEPDTLMLIVPHTGPETYLITNQTPLVNGRTYRFKVRAQDRNGNEEQNNVIVGATARSSAANMTYACVFNPDPGRKVLRSGGVQVMAELQNLSSRSYAETLTFQYRWVLGGAWTDMTPASGGAFHNPRRILGDTKTIYGLHWDAAADAVFGDTDYELRALVTDKFGNVSTNLSCLVRIRLVTSDSDADQSSSTGKDTADLRKKVDARRENDIDMTIDGKKENGDSENLTGRIHFPKGALDDDPTDTDDAANTAAISVTFSLDSNSVPSVLVSGSDTPVGILVTVTITLPDGTKKTSLDTPATVELPYPEPDSNGLIPGIGLAPESLVIRAFHPSDSSTSQWSYDSATNTPSLTLFAVDSTNRLLRFLTNKFSDFALVAPAAGSGGPGNQASLANFMIYPNPYRPNDGNAVTGRPYDPANPRTTGIVFDNLPARVRIEVYTLRGEQVFREERNVLDGFVTWNVKNKSTGRDVASGYYIYIVTDLATGARKTGKLAVIR
ncbi:MAG: hypothetical protein D6679_06395, partial [Candidatus Hydrogenedentota bacterium]